jgi:hypothetical protein
MYTESEGHQFLDTRQWTIFYVNEDYLSLDTDVEIAIKTRNDEFARGTVPKQIFSSLKYEIQFNVTPGTIDSKSPIYLGKIQLCDSQTWEQVLEDTSTINGNTEGTLTPGTDGSSFSWKTKLQFKDLDYSRDYAFQFCLYVPGDLQRPILVMRSPDFNVLARRTDPVVKKRCRQDSGCPQKKSKVESCTLDDYLINLEKLLSYAESLPEKEQKLAVSMALKQLVKEQPKKQEVVPWDAFDMN